MDGVENGERNCSMRCHLPMIRMDTSMCDEFLHGIPTTYIESQPTGPISNDSLDPRPIAFITGPFLLCMSVVCFKFSSLLFTARSELRKVLFLASSFCLCMKYLGNR